MLRHTHLAASLLPLALLAAACGGGDGGTGGNGSTGTGGNGGGGGPGDGTTITTDKGAVIGSIVGETRTFLGVPYAAPPVGDLRWKPPQPHAAWSEPRSATLRGPACAQLGAVSPTFDPNTSEDCLTLNVWAPKDPSAAKAPVMVWIHGGTFILGSGGDASYDGQHLAEATGAVVVTINYRLGPFGFMGHAALKSEDPAHPSSGMYGIEDQRAALAWVKENIAAFGGDAGNVTLFGESAGGFSTCYHLVSPKSEGLFHRAIIESGACTIPIGAAAAAEQKGVDMAQKLGCDGDDPIACLRGKTTEEVILALPASATDILSNSGWFPTVDGFNLPDHPQALLEAGAFAKVPVLLGSNADEGTIFFAFGSPVTDEASYLALAEQLNPGMGNAIVAEYPSSDYGGSPKAAAAAVLGDAAFVCPARRTARALAKGGVSTYLYHFTYAPPGSLLPNLGSFHSAEIAFLFDNPFQLLPESPTAAEAPLVTAIQGYWGRMAKAGDPNGEGAFAWPKYDLATDEALILDLTISKQAGLKADKCDFWDAF